jgi:ribonuclease PH
VMDLSALGEQMITVDCDVLEADGGTRTASITGGFIALVEALRAIEGLEAEGRQPLTDTVAATSVGIVDGLPLLDLDYSEDVCADVDMNVVMTGGGQFVEVQGSGEEATFSAEQLTALISISQQGIAELSRRQIEVLGTAWPLVPSDS